MTISVGDTLPEVELMEIGPDGPRLVPLAEAVGDGKAVILSMPGAFTATCTEKHLPSFQEAMDALKAKGVAHVICVTVNDPFVVKAWGDATGAAADGIRMMADPAGDFTRAVGTDFDAPAVGFVGRSLRFSMLVEGGKVAQMNVEAERGVLTNSSAEAMLAAM